jgi:glycosyltransferase AglD
MYRKISAIVVPTIIAIGIIAWMLFNVWGDLLIALHNIVPVYLIPGVVICLSAWWLRGWRYHSILKSLNYQVGITVAAACIFVSQTVNLIVPARLGDFVRVFILKHEYNTNYSEGVSSLVVERVFDIITVALLGAVSLFFVLNVPPEFYVIIILPLIAGVIFFAFLILSKRVRAEHRTILIRICWIIMVALFAIIWLPFVHKVPSWFYTVIVFPLIAGLFFCLLLVLCDRDRIQNRYIRIFLTMLHEIRKAALSLRSILLLGISSMVIWLLDVLVCISVVLMFGQQIPFAIVVLAIVIGNLVKAVPITPGGVGTYELSLALTFELAGVSPAAATLIAVIDHLIKNLVTLAGGIISVYFFGDWVVPSIKKALNSRLDGEGLPDR